MKTIAILNQKGGCGKTTLTFNCAWKIQEKRNRVLMVDGDEQSNLTSTAGLYPDDITTTLYNVLHDGADPTKAILPTRSRCDLISGGLGMATADYSLDGKKPLCEALDAISGNYDYCMIDTSPHLGAIAAAAITAADLVIIPVTCSLYDLQAVPQVREFIDAIKPDVEVALVISRYTRSKSTQTIEDMLRQQAENLEIKMFNTRIRESAAIRNAVNFEKPIFLYNKRSAACEDFQKLADEIIIMCESEVEL